MKRIAIAIRLLALLSCICKGLYDPSIDAHFELDSRLNITYVARTHRVRHIINIQLVFDELS